MQLELVKDLPDYRENAELYRKGENYYVVSTIASIEAVAQADPEMALLCMLGGAVGLPTSGEETAVFRADADGEVADEDWDALIVEAGEGSRERALEKLR